MGYQPNQIEADPIDKEVGEGDSIYVEDNVEEVELDVIYVGWVFSDENKAYEMYNSYTLTKGFGVPKGKTTKCRTDGKTIRRQFVLYKEGH